jgi:MoaA/NifB/PqqE/SkfB family radical SAM enzyme
MCDIWKDTSSHSLSMAVLERLLDDFQALSVKWIVLSGGEPLMHPRLFEFCARAHERRIRITLLSTGLLFERNAQSIIETIDDAIVSLDGPPEIHDRIRRVTGAFALLERGVRTIHNLKSDFGISARTTIQRQNFAFLNQTARTARSLGLNGISFLAADVTSTAFNRPDGWDAERQSEVTLTAGEVPHLELEIENLISEWCNSGFVSESPEKLRRLVTHFRAQLGDTTWVAPTCNAPWTSTVIEADGMVRPCFFHRSIGRLNGAGLLNILNGPEAVDFRSTLRVSENPTCRRCVCSLNWKTDPGV